MPTSSALQVRCHFPKNIYARIRDVITWPPQYRELAFSYDPPGAPAFASAASPRNES